MNPVLVTERAALFNGDASQIGLVLDADSVDAIVTDPPAGIGFMGKSWDGDKGGREQWIAWLAAELAAAFAALKPGGHALVWAIPRTSHWTATALELCGFEIRDVVMHLFGTGFPKSMNVEKAIGDRPEAAEWSGWGTALKPAAEHWILARKPLIGTVAANVLTHGTGALNIDACRIGEDGGGTQCSNRDVAGNCKGHENAGRSTSGETFHGPDSSGGRWPAHLVLDEDAAAQLDAQAGPSVSRRGKPRKSAKPGDGYGMTATGAEYDDAGGPSRFFYVAKPTRRERDAGLDHITPASAGEATDRKDGSAGLNNPRAGAGRTGGARNTHPTAKSIALMRWLCRLITPPGGLVLDPFTGSGSTGLGALAEGFEFVGVEQSSEYANIAAARIQHALASKEPSE